MKVFRYSQLLLLSLCAAAIYYGWFYAACAICFVAGFSLGTIDGFSLGTGNTFSDSAEQVIHGSMRK